MPPELMPGADELLEAFWELSSDRQIGMQAGPIPSMAIHLWASRTGLADDDQFAEFRDCIRAMDSVWLGQGEATPPAKPVEDARLSARPMSMELFDALFA